MIRKFQKISPEIDLRVLFFRKDFFLENTSDIYYLDKFIFFDQKDRHVINLSQEQFINFSNYFNLIEKRIRYPSLHSSDIVRSFIDILINEIDDIISRDTARTSQQSRNDQLLLEFKVLVSNNFYNHRQLSFYSDKLNVTPKHLSSVIKQVSGKTANEWINEMVLLESQVLLKKNNLTIAQIADRLNFTDTSHFGKFFKKKTGISPLSYKNS